MAAEEPDAMQRLTLPLRASGMTLEGASSAVLNASAQAPISPQSEVPDALHGKRKTAFFTSEICEGHHIVGHPECFQRTQVIRERLLADFSSLQVVRDINKVTEAQLLLFHSKKHVDSISSMFQRVHEHYMRPDNKGRSVLLDIDGDTAIMEGTEDAAMVAAGAVCQAIDLVMSENSDAINAFCGVRPPGHHAEPEQAMGFCLFNNIGIGACHLLHRYPDDIKKVLILDFDVHHGNGTQAKFAFGHPSIRFISTHQGEFYPFTGKAHERGTHDNIVNVPLSARTASQAYRSHFERKVLPVMHEFQPDFILISAGFDAHRLDPLADIALETEDYYWITKNVTDIAWKYANGRIVSSLEGGYNLKALADSAAAHVRALVEGAVPPKPSTETDPNQAEADVDSLTQTFAAAVALNSEGLRVTMHFEGKEKLILLQDRTAKALMQQCKNKFCLKKRAKAASLQDAHGTIVTDDVLRTLPADQHLYIR